MPIQLSIGTGASRMAASTVPRISAPIAEYTVSWIVVQNASKICAAILWLEDLHVPSPGSGACSVAVDGRRCGRGVIPAGPRFLSNAAFHAPSGSIFFSASLILVRSSVSSFFRPMPYFSSENGLPTILNAPGLCAAYPARITSSVVTASTAPFFSASTHAE